MRREVGRWFTIGTLTVGIMSDNTSLVRTERGEVIPIPALDGLYEAITSKEVRYLLKHGRTLFLLTTDRVYCLVLGAPKRSCAYERSSH